MTGGLSDHFKMTEEAIQLANAPVIGLGPIGENELNEDSTAISNVTSVGKLFTIISFPCNVRWKQKTSVGRETCKVRFEALSLKN